MLRLRSYERLLVENRRFRSNGGLLTQNFTKKGSPPTNHSSSQKSEINIISYGINIWTDLSSILSVITRVTDGHRQTDRRTEFSSLDRVCIACSAVKIQTFTLLSNARCYSNLFASMTSPTSPVSSTVMFVRSKVRNTFWSLLSNRSD